jgi:hypothetical protein
MLMSGMRGVGKSSALTWQRRATSVFHPLCSATGSSALHGPCQTAAYRGEFDAVSGKIAR